jgi:MFS family permease
VLQVFNLAKIVAIFGGAFNVVALLIMSQFFGGFGAYALVTLSYTLLYDFCSDQYRPKAVVIVNAAWSVSTIGLGVSYLLAINWMNFLIYIVLIPLIVVSVGMYKFVMESPYILMGQNKKYEALEVLTKIAIINGRSDQITEIRELIQTEHEKTE